MKKKQEKQPKGRPVTRKIEQIDASPEEIAKAMFRNADRKLEASKKIKDKRLPYKELVN